MEGESTIDWNHWLNAGRIAFRNKKKMKRNKKANNCKCLSLNFFFHFLLRPLQLSHFLYQRCCRVFVKNNNNNNNNNLDFFVFFQGKREISWNSDSTLICQSFDENVRAIIGHRFKKILMPSLTVTIDM